MTLGEALKRDNNNMDLLRLIAACAVIWHHAFFLASNAHPDPIGTLLKIDDPGGLAVRLFFFISGMLVTDSLVRNPSAIRFASARFFRIFPALIVCALLCIFVIGPLATTLPLAQYFSYRSTFLSVLLQPYAPYWLPCVFTCGGPFSETNGAIWTIRYEIQFYILWMALGLCGLFRVRWLASATLIAIIVLSLIDGNLITEIGVPVINGAAQFPSMFAFGALLAINKDRVVLSGRLVCGLVVLALLMRHSPNFKYAFDAAFLIGALWLSTTKAARSIRLPGDFSYGVYVFGWPIQKTVMWLIPLASVATNQILSISAALVIGAVSWFMVEKPSLAIGRAIPDLLSRRRRITSESFARAETHRTS